MRRLIFLVILFSFLAQSSIRTIMIVQWKLYQKEITELYCVNKSRPEMQCNGSCHLAKQMRRIESDYEQSKKPFAPKHLKPVDFQLFCQQSKLIFISGSDHGSAASKGGAYQELQPQFSASRLLNPPQAAANIG